MDVKEFQDLLYEIDDKGILTVTINKPERKNALSALTLLELWYALEHAEKDKTVKVMILTGSKEANAFCSGGYFSMNIFKNIPDEARKEVDISDMASKKLALKFWDFSKPIIAAVNGLGVGAGFTIPVICADLAYASEDAWFGLYFIKRAVIGDFGSTFFLPSLIGFKKAKELFYFGDKITAQQAKELDLINEVVPSEDLMSYAREQAMRLIPPKGPSLALRSMKKSMHAYYKDILEKQLDVENELWNKCVKSKDFRESLAALKEKREPVFK